MAPFSSPQGSGALIRFRDRHDAGKQLAQAVLEETMTHPATGTVRYAIYALPRGGLPVAEPVAQGLNAPLDVIVAKKITRPDNSELAIGAVTADGHVVWAPQRRVTTGVFNQNQTAMEEAMAHAQAQWHDLSPSGPRCHPGGAIALIVDDGIATGMTMAAAVKSLRAQQAAEIWICAPVAPLELMPFLSELGDRVVVLATPTPFHSVSRFYQEFPQVSTAEAVQYLPG